MEFAKRFDNVSSNAIREILALVSQPGMISFAGGNPSPGSFPKDDLADIAAKLIREQGEQVLQYGVTPGLNNLKETSLKMAQKRGIKAGIEEVMIVSGATQGNGLAIRTILNPGDAILMESPTFIGALMTSKGYEANIQGVEMDEYGMIMEDLEEKIKKYHPKLVYTTPTFQNPTGKTLPMERRKKMVELCKANGVIIVEDDAYYDLRYSGEAVPPIKAFDKDGDTVIYVMSYSKIISPGLRVAAVFADPSILAKYNVAKQGEDLHTANLTQQIVNAYVNSGKLEGHIEEICAEYKVKRDAMLKKLESWPKSIKYTVPDGGLFIFLEPPKDVDSMPIFKAAIKKKVAFILGETFYPVEGVKHTIRLNFSMPSIEQINEGMDILRSVVEEYI